MRYDEIEIPADVLDAAMEAQAAELALAPEPDLYGFDDFHQEYGDGW